MMASPKVANNELDDLPDDLIHHILSFMETKDAVQTCVLSTRWRYMWTSIPCLNFNTKSFTQLADFKRFVKHVLSQRDDTTTSQWLLNHVIEFATSHGVEEIRINFGGKSSDNPPTEIPSYLFASQSLERISFKSCHTTNLPTSVVGSKSLEILHLEHFPLPHPDDEANSSNPFSRLPKLFDFAKLTTLHLNSFTLGCTAGTTRLDPFVDCVNLKNLHLSECCFESELNKPGAFVISTPQLKNLTLACNLFNCNLVIAAPKLTNLKYTHSSAYVGFDFGLPSSDDFTIDILDLHDESEIYDWRHREEKLHTFINIDVQRPRYAVGKVGLSFRRRKAKVTRGAASSLPKFEVSLSPVIRFDVKVGYTSRISIRTMTK
ncbi:hypothetical protein K1719_019471 [Acacia pycnantha]|nr:hypothetical protein K1719_019471 [Acacia pycnantha]